MPHTESTIAGIDIGSNTVSVLIAEVSAAGAIKPLGTGACVTAGVEKGIVTQFTDFRKSIERAIQRAVQAAGVRPVQAVSNVPLGGCRIVRQTSVVQSKDPSGYISVQDQVDVTTRCKQETGVTDLKLIHAIPLAYKVDHRRVENPVGMFGSRLELEANLVYANPQNVRATLHAVRSCGLRVGGLAWDLLAFPFAVSMDYPKGCAVLDIGGRFTKLGLYYDGLLYEAAVVPIGGDTLTSDLAICLNLTVPEAERVKILYGHVSPLKVPADTTIDVHHKTEGQHKIEQRLVARIIEARVHELLRLLQDKIPMSRLPEPILLTRPTLLLPGFSALLSAQWQRKVVPCKRLVAVPDERFSVLPVGLIGYAYHHHRKTPPTRTENTSPSLWFRVQRHIALLIKDELTN